MKKVKNVQSYMRKVKKCMKKEDLDSFSKEVDRAFDKMKSDIKFENIKIRF